MPQDHDVVTDNCGCTASPRRLCDVCHSPKYAFLACSNACLARHLAEKHGDKPSAAEARARAFQRDMNERAPNAWDNYAHHRQQVMGHVPAGGGTICVFGAGNCADLDLDFLGQRFTAIHLVDLDGASLARARERQPLALRERIVAHDDVDLSGFLGKLDTWGEAFPDDGELAQAAVITANDIVASLGGPFDVTLSTCCLSQLVVPFQKSWVKTQMDWLKFGSATTAVHLATLAGATRSGGAGFIAFDVLSSDHAPGLRDFVGRPAEELDDFVFGQVQQGDVALEPDPGNLVEQLESPGLGSLMQSPELTLPWLWDIRSAYQLVFGLSFRRP